MRTLTGPLLLLLAAAAGGCSISGGSSYQRHVNSWKEVKEKNVVIQASDYTCGPAALATLMRYYFGDDVSEQKVFEEAQKKLSPDEILDRRRDGFTMEDLRRTAVQLGYDSDYYNGPMKDLIGLPFPMVVHVVRDELKHFVVFRGATADRVYLADPSHGNIRIPAGEFAEEWTGNALYLDREGFDPPSIHALSVNEADPLRPGQVAARRALFGPR